MSYILIDNYDSFTYNLLHYMGSLGAETLVIRNDVTTPEKIIEMKPKGIIISPGPSTPDDAGICLDLIKKAADKIPILGVCLGHQSIGQAFGGRIVRALKPMHGKTSKIIHSGQGIFKDIPSPFIATRYHSLIIDRASLPKCFDITAEVNSSEEGNIIMAIQHKKYNIHGVQFHPESIASEHGHKILKNFMLTIN